MTDKMADQLFAPEKICPKNRINKPFRRNSIFISADDFESVMSAIPSHRPVCFLSIIYFPGNCKSPK